MQSGGFLKKEYIISIDMGGTKILSALLNSTDGIITRVKKPTESGASQNRYIKALSELVTETVESAGLGSDRIKAVCIGIPGSLNPYSGRIGIAPNLGIKNFDIKEKLQAKIPYPVLIENDVNLGAMGIKHFGLGKNAKDLLVVFIGTGIGAGLILDNKIFRGANYAAGEIGHLKVVENGPLCGCGKHGCFEAVASRSAIVRDILRDIKNGKKSTLPKIKGKGKQIKSKALAQAVDAKDKVVIENLSNACRRIGTVLGNVTNLLNLDLIVLGGGLIEALGGFMLPIIKDEFKKVALKDSSKGLKILSSKLADDAALYGGIPLAEEFLSIKV